MADAGPIKLGQFDPSAHMAIDKDKGIASIRARLEEQSHLALRLLRREDPKWKYVQVRSSQYLNNLIEQDHRAIKRRCTSMGGFKSFGSAAITLAGIELAHRIRKRQFSFGRGRYQNFGSLKQIWDRALA